MALTVEELQIKLGCDATEAQKVLSQVDALVDKYTKQFQGYFDNIGGKSSNPLGNVAENMEREAKSSAKSIESITKRAKESLKDMVDFTPKYKHTDLGYGDISKTINEKIKNGREAAEAYNEEFAKARPSKEPPNTKLLNLGVRTAKDLQAVYAQANKIGSVSGVMREKIFQAYKAMQKLGEEYSKIAGEEGGSSKAAQKAEEAYRKAIYAVDKYVQQLGKAVTKEEELAQKEAELAAKRLQKDPKQVRAGNINAENNPQWGKQGEGRMLAPSFAETFKATLASLPDLINSFVMKSTDALSKVGGVIGKTFAVGANVAIGAVRMIGTVAETTARAIGRAFKGAVSLIRGMVGAAQKVGNAIKRAFNHTLLGKFLKRLGSVMMRMAAMKLIRGTIEGVKKGLEELAKTSNSSAKAMNSIKAAGGSIKMALGAAVMPIVKALVPVFVEIAGVVNAAANAIARFFAVLTGQGQYTAVNFSGDLDGISESASGAGSAVKGMLADFDELNVLQKNSGGGGGSSGVEQSLSNVVDDQTAFSELGEIIRNSILHGDWSGAATAITDKLNALIRDVPWGDIGTLIGTYLDGALEFLATAITTFDWNGIGASLAEACNAAIVRVNWENLGTVLSAKFSIVIRSLGSFLENLNFAELADGFSKFAIGFFDGITNAIESVDWKKIGENVKTFLKDVNWSGIADSIMEGIGAALGGLAALIWGLIEEAWDNVVKWWKDVAYEDGQFTISGLLDGIVNALSSIGTWIKEHIFNPIINGFKKAFGIASPAKEMNEPGQMVGEGILEGLASAFKSIVTWLDENIFTPLVNGIEEGAKAVWAWLETAVSNVGLFFDKIEAALGIGIEYVVAFFKTIVDTITAKAETIKLGAEKIVADVKTAVLQKLKDLVDALNDGPVGKLLKAIGVDLTNASASLGKKIDESKEKSQQLDAAIQDAQATASKGFDIEANVNQEKVTEFKKTLDTPYSAYVEPTLKDSDAFIKDMNNKVTGKTSSPWKALTEPMLKDGDAFIKDMDKKVTGKTSKPWQALVNPKYNNGKQFVKDMGDKVTGKTSTPWKALVNPMYNNGKQFVKDMGEKVTGQTSKPWKALVDPKYNSGAKFVSSMKEHVTGQTSSPWKALVDPKYNSGVAFTNDMNKKVTGATSTSWKALVDPKYNNGTSFVNAMQKNVTGQTSASWKALVDPKYNSDTTFFAKLREKVTGVTNYTSVNPTFSVTQTYTKAVSDATADKTLTIKASLSIDKTKTNNAISAAMKGASAKVNLTIGGETVTGDIKTYASGGIAYGTTSAIIGEYVGAKSNPEVVAPLSKLQGILERSNVGSSKDTMTREQANTMIRLLQQIEKKELAVKPSLSLAEVVRQSNNALSRT